MDDTPLFLFCATINNDLNLHCENSNKQRVTYKNLGVCNNFCPPLCLGRTSSKKKYMWPIAIPTRSTEMALPRRTEKPSNTHGRYGACKHQMFVENLNM